MTIDMLEKVLAVMRRNGVTDLTMSDTTDGGLLVLKLAPEQVEHAPIKASDFSADIDMCHCGHSMPQHGDHGLCLMGCDGEKCEGGQGAAQ